jgi:phytoene dehydrogenase-like protein
MAQITVVGGGLAGLIAAISCAEKDADVRLLEAHHELGGRARSTSGPYVANLGPHAIYKDGPKYRWLAERGIAPPLAALPLSGIRFRRHGEIQRTPPLAAIPAVLRLRGREAPVERDFRSWAADHADERVAAMLAAAAGLYTFHYDPGTLSAAFVWRRMVRVLLSMPPAAGYVVGGWGRLVESLERHARALGVEIVTDARVTELPAPPVIVATELADARALLRDDALNWPSGATVCIDLGLRRRGDPFFVSDLDEAGAVERYTAADPSLAPEGEELVQAQMPIRPGEHPDAAARRLERLLDLALPDRRERETWHRRQVMISRTGAVDPPHTTWRDRPEVDRGGGVFLAGDMVAAPGLLSEVAWASAVDAAARAVDVAGRRRGRLRQVA